MRLSPLEERITKLIDPVVSGMGFDLYCVQETSEDGAYIIQIMAEDPKTGRLSVENCTALSRAISAVMDVEDPIKGEYRLEISSPGIDRLLIRAKDYLNYIGFEAKLEIDPPINGQKRFRGRLTGLENETVLMKTEDQGDVTLPLDRIQKAKLVMSDELVKTTQKRIKELEALQDSKENEEVIDHGTAASR